MNPNLTQLLRLLNLRRSRDPGGAGPLEQGQLIEALRLISAPYSLEAVAQYCGRLIKLVDGNPAIKPPELGEVSARWAIIREIAAVGADDLYFARSHYPPDSATPLQPCTGDGPLCDVLMLEARNPADQPQFQRITEWFVWLCMRFHHKTLTASVYAGYLDGEESAGNRLNKDDAGGPISAAGCQIRKLGDPDQQVGRDALCNLGLELSDEHGRYLARLAHRVHRVTTIGAGDIKRWARDANLSDDDARLELEYMRNDVHGAIRHVLRLLWRRVDGRDNAVRRHVDEARRDYSRPRVQRYGWLREEIAVDDPDAHDAGVSISVYESESPVRPRLPQDAWVDDGKDPDEPDGDALYQVYVAGANDDPVATYYAARGRRYADEYGNAWLPWSKTRLGRDALRVLVASLQLTGAEVVEVRAAKLIILLGVMTGRALSDARETWIDQGAGNTRWRDAEIVVSLPERALYIRAATPDLKPSEKRRERRMTHPMGKYLAVELPILASDLLGDGKWLGGQQLSLPRYEQVAKDWIAALPVHFELKPSLLRDSLVFLLLEQTRGDLGLVKLITNRNSLNFANIIHYAAYPADRASTIWAQVLTQLLGTEVRARPTNAQAAGRMPYVGTPDAIDKEGLRAELDRLRARLRDCWDGQDLEGAEKLAIRAHNLLTLYTLLWLNLATAGRARVSPAPVAIIKDLALVADKHREDGSAERLVPLTTGVLAQLRAYFAYVWHLAFRMPELRPVVDAFSSGVIQFQFLTTDGQVSGYRPKWLYEEEKLISLPGNWARKLVRQELTEIGGRYLDAGMGHWVAGRHPYRVTSNFAFRRFREVWLAGEERLERELGFDVVVHPQVTGTPIEWPVVSGLRRLAHTNPAKRPTPGSTEPMPVIDFEAECRRVDEVLYEGICEAESKDPKAVAALVLKVARSHPGGKAQVRKFIDACCAAARKTWRVPIFANTPRYQFQQDWVINKVALYNLGYFTARVLPAFYAELEHLPAAGNTECADSVDLGRFLMLCIWRQGLVTWPVLDAFLQSFCAGGILATGPLRYVSSRVRCRRNGVPMDRIHYLEQYCQVYFVVEYARLRAALMPLFNKSSPQKWNPQKRRAHMQSALGQYLRTLVTLDAANLLTVTFNAAQQYHLIHGSPVLAAYASAEFETHDLSDDEIRHLAGYETRSVQASSLHSTSSLEQTSREQASLPSHELERSQDIVRQIAYRRSPRLEQMCRDTESITVRSPTQRLLQVFAVWYLQRQAKTQNGRLGSVEKRRFEHVIEVVGYALVGFGVGSDESATIDEAFLVNLQEQFQDLYVDIDSSAPFQVFRRFLRQRAGRFAAEKAGFTIGEIEPPAQRGVLAKVVTAACMHAVSQSIGRVDESGIGNPDARTVARRHVDFTALFGLRRTEAVHVREMDVQGDLIRVQPYGEHRLKTAWSDRILPMAFTGFADMAWINTVRAASVRQCLAHGLPRTVNGDNYFDAVNKLVQREAADPRVHLHTLRHTVASRLLLSALSDAVDYDKTDAQFPWLPEFRLPASQMEVLSGGEGQSGHGLQAIAALLGHSHPLTTLRHYVHTVGIAFYAHLSELPALDVMRAFEFRLGSSRTMRRRINGWRTEVDGMESAAAEAFVHQNVLAEAETLCPGVVLVEERARPVGSPGQSDHDGDPEQCAYDPQAISYERLARVETILRGEAPNDIGLDVAQVWKALAAIYEIQTGKRGSDRKRHPVYALVDGRRLPRRLPAKSPTRAAAGLCTWLEHLRARDRELFDWLVDRWLHLSEREFGRMRLDADDRARWQQLLDTFAVTPLPASKEFKRKPDSNRADRVQQWWRIRHRNPDGGFNHRDVSAFRWVMTWTCALLTSAD